MAYQGYTGYDEAGVKRQRDIADALMQRVQQPREIRHWTQGVAQLAEALMARQAGQRADSAEKSFTDSRKQIADSLLGQMFPGDAAAQAYPDEFTPEQQQLGALAGSVRGIADLTGDPMSAVKFGLDEQDRQYERTKPTLMNTRAGVVSVAPDGKGTMAYEIPEETPEPPDLPTGMRYGGADGKTPEWIPGYKEGYREMHPSTAGSSGNAPPSGYRWKKDGSLEKIPGGPADKPAGSEFTQTQVNRFTGQAQGLDAIEFAVQEFQDAINKYGTVTGDRNMNPLDPGSFGAKRTDAAELDAKHNHLTMLLKSPEMFNLGVLTGPDLELLLKSVPDPTGWESIGTNKENVTASLDALRRFIAYRRGQIPEKFQVKKQEQPQQRQGGILGLLEQFRQGAPQNAPSGPQAAPESDISPDIEALLDEALGPDEEEDTIPEGWDPEDWQYLTDAEKAEARGQ